VNHYTLAMPFTEIVDCIGKEKSERVHDQLALFEKMQNYF